MLKFMGPKVLNTLKNLSFYNRSHTKKSFISKYKNYLLDSPYQYTHWQHQYFIASNHSIILFSILSYLSFTFAYHCITIIHHLTTFISHLYQCILIVFLCPSSYLFHSTMQLFFGVKCFIYFSHIILMAQNCSFACSQTQGVLDHKPSFLGDSLPLILCQKF